MAPRATATIDPVKIRHYDHGLRCDVRQVVGYRAKCQCGWRSSTFANVRVARVALTNHRAVAHNGKPEAASPTSETAA